MTAKYDRDAPHTEPIIHRPDADDLKLAMESGRVCGLCQHFSVAEGQRLMEAQKFVERLVREEQWKVHHLCSPLNDLGLCGQTVSGSGSDAVAITGRLHKACDHFRENRGLVSISRKTTDAK